MLSVNNRRQTPISSAADIPTKVSGQEDTPETVSPAESPRTDSVTISERPEKPLMERPINFVNNFTVETYAETDLFVRLHNRLPVLFDEYASGDISKETMLRTLDRAVSDVVGYYANKGFDPEEITPEIVRELYANCKLEMVRAGYSKSLDEGAQIAREKGINGFWMYYNADHYYFTEDLIDTVHDHLESLSEKYGCGPMKLERDFPEGDIRRRYYGSYNAYFNARLRSTGGSMIDQTIAPPKDFKMFFDSNSKGTSRYPSSMGAEIPGEPSLFDSAVYIQYQGWEFAHRLPTRMDPTRYPVSVHLMDVIQSSKKGYPKEIEAFLNNFDFFATNVGKMYWESHELIY